jgi:hypothetical protein
MAHIAFNLISTKGQKLTKVNDDIVMVTQIGENLSIRFLDGSTDIFTNTLDELVHAENIFPVTLDNYIGAVNAKHILVCQEYPNNYTEIFFKSYTKLGSIVVKQSQDDILILINGASDHLGSVLFEDTEYIGGNSFLVPEDSNTNLPNNTGNKVDYDAPNYALDWVNTSGVVIPNRALPDFYLLNLSFTANPENKDQVLELSFVDGTTVLWAKTVVLNADKNIDTDVSENIFFFSSSTMTTTGGVVKITPLRGDVEITNIKFLVSAIHNVETI